MKRSRKKLAFALAIAMVMVFAAGGSAYAAEAAPEEMILEEASANAEEVTEDIVIDEAAAVEEPVESEYNEEAEAELAATDLSYVAGEVIVVFEAGRGADAYSYAAELNGEVAALNTLAGVGDAALIKISRSQTVRDAINAYSAKDGVLYAEENGKVAALEIEPALQQAIASAQNTLNDPRAKEQWYTDKIEAGAASDMLEALPAREKVLVAVVDSLVDMNHEDLTNIYNKEISRSFINGREEPYPQGPITADHATHVSGIIAAEANNGKGIAGVASGTKNQMVELMSCAVLGEKGGTNYSVALGVDYAVKKGADVINLSLGSYSGFPQNDNDRIKQEAIDNAVSGGAVVIGAAGNGDTNSYCTPSDYESVISVIATTNYTDPEGYCKTAFSDFGVHKDISAPGERILSAIPGGYTYFNGTSMAAPMVAGVAAMMKYASPDITPAQVQDGIESTATDLFTEGFDLQTAWGNVNAKAAVEYALAITPPDPPGPTPIVPVSPKDLKQTGVTADSITLGWSPGKNVEGYLIFRTEAKYKGDLTQYTQIADLEDASILSYTDKGVITGKRYGYALIGYGLDENGKIIMVDQSNTIYARAKCDAPTGLKAAGQSKSSINLRWDSTAGADGFYLYRSTSKTGGYKLVAKFNGGEGVSSYSDRGLKAATKYYYKLIAITNAEDGPVKGATAGPVAGQTKRA